MPAHSPSDHHHPHTTSTSHISSSSQTTTSSYFLGATTTIRRRRGAVVHKAIQKNGTDGIDDIVVGDVTPFQPLLLGPHRNRRHRRPPTPPTTTTKPATTIDAMSDLPTLPAQPNGTHDHHPSYAEAASHNAPPLSAQPHPDKNLLYTGPSPTRPTTAPDIENKVSVVPRDWAAHPTTETSLHIDVAQSGTDVESDDNEGVNISGSTKRRARKQRERSDRTYNAKREVKTFWRHFTDRVVHPGPGLIGGTITLLNLGVLSGIGYTLYAHPHARTNPRFLGLSGLGVFALLSVEGLTAERYLDSPQGHQTQQEIVTLKRKAKEVILRPGVFGGLLGAANISVLAALGWFAYDQWNETSVWTRRNLSIVSVSLLGWFGGQGLIVEQYATNEYPLRKERK